MTLKVTPLRGPELAAHLPELARLRVTVFREYPYLYAGSADYEETYLRPLLQTPDALVVLAQDGAAVVGASSALPLTQETEALQRPLLNSPYDPAQVLYLGESVLLPEYRGRGLGHAFFDHREAHAAQLGLGITAFCAVQRPEQHPARPQPARSLHAFWAARGYREHPELAATLHWPEIPPPLGTGQDTAHPMHFWVRA
ncbi:GNAT family N-acetyltransferase [Deinococcus sp. HMF7620]|uniref:GNAT family N-acetyltransferase n=1 Tax=Deinococcus arboris TaxID=2682977 RepID=A0A7C9MSB8_9DEIO|nr:GNAT family N-acetyltransferase [Deinococcus arboris]MVN87944.1 GNAT family N-acetyltransferase [Deinococcus arboris]